MTGQPESQVRQLDALPPRQREVTNLILAGHTPKSIALEMGLSIYTVREHLETVYRKFGVSGRDELMALFIPIFHQGFDISLDPRSHDRV